MNPLQSYLDARARQSAAVFAGLALRDEVTGKLVRMVAHHRQWPVHVGRTRTGAVAMRLMA